MKSVSISFAEQLHLKRSASAKRIQVVFGSPKKDCRYRGICRIEPDVWDELAQKESNSTCTGYPAHVEIDAFSRLQLHFVAAELSEQQFNHQFANETFTIIDKYELPLWLKQLLDFEDPTESWALAPCRYPVLTVGPLLTVSLRLIHVQREQNTDTFLEPTEASCAA